MCLLHDPNLIKMKIYYPTLLALVIGLVTNAQDLTSTMHVSAGTPVYVSVATTVSTDQINLKSTSNQFSTLFLNEDLDPSIVVNYDRYINIIGTLGMNGGNDLISMPVKTSGVVTVNDFLGYTDGTTINSSIIPNSPTLETMYAFGPYNNSTQSYENFDTAIDGNVEIRRGVGYRAASHSGQTVRFTGLVSTLTESVDISSNANGWNLVGNPYPTYLNSLQFLSHNAAVLNPSATAIYGYNSGTYVGEGPGSFGNFTVINNLTNSNSIIAPGQGFLVANNPDNLNGQVSFTMAMRSFNGTDDFVLGRSSSTNEMLRLKVVNNSAEYATEIYFNENSTRGLDPGYDAANFDGLSSNLLLYSQLVENNTGENMAIQSLDFDSQNNVIIPLGLKANQGEEITFSIDSMTLPDTYDVYLEDNLTNTFTLLNNENYSFVPQTNIDGTGRFFLRLGTDALSIDDVEGKNLYISAQDQTVYIRGLLFADSQVFIYDIQGRLVNKTNLKEGSNLNSIRTNNLSSGIYVVKLSNIMHEQTEKVILR